jgi:RHS repeat-associated protein
MKTVSGVTTLYINRYYEINLNTDVETSSYYLGDRLVAQLEGETLKYIHQDSLSSSSVMSDDEGQLVSSIKYYPFGETKSGSVDTDKQFTGQRHDDTGLYYYGARYYDPTIGRFISADLIITDLRYSQCLNRYSYTYDNPLRYTDPTGWFTAEELAKAGLFYL